MNGCHDCPVAGCRSIVLNTKLMCPTHWRMVPLQMQNKIYRAYQRSLRGMDNGELREAQLEAVTHVEDTLKPKPPTEQQGTLL